MFINGKVGRQKACCVGTWRHKTTVCVLDGICETLSTSVCALVVSNTDVVIIYLQSNNVMMHLVQYFFTSVV